MRRIDEIEKLDSCLNKSADDEWIFVLTARDAHAPAAVRKWADDYEASGGRPEKVAEARACADNMEAQREEMIVRRQNTHTRSVAATADVK